MRLLTITLLSLCVWCVHGAPQVTAFRTGAPTTACNSLSPNASAHLALPTVCPGDSCPFTMRVFGADSNQYRCGDTLKILIVGELPFRGFFTQSRVTSDSGTFSPNDAFVGNFVDPGQQTQWQIIPCDGSHAGATHRNNDDKTLVTLQWKAPLPGEPAPSVTFWLTIVQTRQLYHVQLPGLLLEPDEMSCQSVDSKLRFRDSMLMVLESSGSVAVCVELVERAVETVIATLESMDGTAIVGEDYEILDGTILFAEGSSSGDVQCFTVAIVADNEREDNDETFSLMLRSDQAVIDPDRNQFVVTIIDESTFLQNTVKVLRRRRTSRDVILGFQQQFHTVFEGQSEEVCVVILSGVANQTLSLQMLSIFARSASEDDIEEVIRVVEFPEGSREGDTQCVDVVTIRDQIPEQPEVLFLVLFDLPGAEPTFEIDRNRMVVPFAIVEDPNPSTAVVSFIETQEFVSESVDLKLAYLLFTTATTLNDDVKINITSRDGTAMSFSTDLDPPDFLPVNSAITIPGGTPDGTSFSISVSIIDDEVLEDTERFVLRLRSLSPDILSIADGGDQQIVFILDNEPRTSRFGLETNELEVREGRENAVRICLEMLSPGPLLQDVVFDLVGQSGSATVNEDFTVLLLQFPTPQIVFPTGSRSGNTSCGYFTIVDDNYAEVFEVFSINFVSQNEDVAAISDSTLTVSIEDDDVLYVGFERLTLGVEEDEGEGFVCVEVLDTNPGPVFNDLRVRIATADGTALAMEDYTMQQTELIFAPGTTVGDVQCLGVPIIDNNRPDDPRNFSVNLVSFSPLVRVYPQRNYKNVSILDNDASQVEFAMAVYRVSEAASNVSVCVRLLGDGLNTNGLVRVSTEDFTAFAGADYEPFNNVLAFPNGTEGGSTVCVSIEIIDDNILEVEQSFRVSLSSVTPNVFSVADDGSVSTVIIVDNEVAGLPQIAFETDELSLSEDVNEAVMVCIRLTGGDLTQQQAIIDLVTQPGTANDEMDYLPLAVTITLSGNSPNGTRSCTALTILDDDEMERREYFTVRINNLTPNVVTIVEGEESLMVRILDDDSPMAVVGFQVIESKVNESVATKFTCLEIFSGGPLRYNATVLFYTQDGSAVAPADYGSVRETLTFRAGADGSQPTDAVCVSVPIVDDVEVEDTESLTFNIVALDVDQIRVDESRSQKVLYIEDNDAVQAGFEQTTYAVLENVGDNNLGLLACVRVEDVSFPFSLTVSTEDISAEEILDYRVNNSPLQFFVAGGNQTQCAYVQVINDSILEGPEQFTLLLSSEESAVVVNNPSATVTIMDDIGDIPRPVP